jgi:hypothetical protein
MLMLMLNDEIEKKSIKKTKKIYSSQPGLTCQTCDPGHDTRITR